MVKTKETLPAEETLASKETIAPREEIRVRRPAKSKLSPEEPLRRMEAFDERKEQIIAAVRKSAS